jgi:hypothetical protein
MTEVRPPSVRSVKAALRKAELPEAVLAGRGWRTRHVIRTGWHAWEVAGEIRVAHWSPAHLPTSAKSAALGRYQTVLAEAGWKVIEDERGGFLAVLAARPAKEGGSND